ncbi:hypothetical protein [Salmonirosea aquatica]|uniref:Glycosyltransferase family 61 protein n=1 Tax=Salmonirosea aquatica TaxID=2654236 RepID=A0A7C9F4H8_9BACT|nr:hypothetical protein [Cytophagaceae bacterium SJW1-29]
MLQTLFRKAIGLYVRLRYGSVAPELRWFYKDTIRCKLVQAKYLLRDYIFKKPYKTLDFSGEFAPELQFVLPFAYWHHQNGTLKNTVSSRYTRELYFFSPQHEEKYDTRTNEGNYNFEMPRILYSQDYDMDKWAPVPLKAHYQNSVYRYDKPMVVVANRYNSEWGGPPISYFGLDLLDFMFSQLKEHYTVIYNRPRPQNITMDNSDIYDLDEFDWIARTHPEVVLMEDLFRENRGQAHNFNHFQLQLYANADKFISIHGGTATLASYFGGTNLILSKQGPEHHFHCFQKLYPQFSGATILHARTDEEVKQYLQAHFLPTSPASV